MNELKSILNLEKKNFGYYLKATWYFEKAVDKIVLITLGILGMWKLLEFFI